MYDKTVGKHFLVDTGADISVLPVRNPLQKNVKSTNFLPPMTLLSTHMEKKSYRRLLVSEGISNGNLWLLTFLIR
ncbi:hypothetical protein FF38_04518 [Lucilia cuprina]|uniref:Peptidase A2 domain-containing protein n=1 Tax=Lucilia cuprina TaxID=7375 RepID=A0A0L0BPI6_LUCCU|nr:hypothetical protein FF38_04518 [Lucilia cuprina]